MRSFFSARLIGTIAATAIALTAFAAPQARAQGDRTAQTIATILGLAIVGKIIHDDRQDRKRRKDDAYIHRRAPEPRAHAHNSNLHRHGDITHNHHDGRYAHNHTYTRKQPRVRPLPHRVDRKLLPKKCFRSYDTRQGRYYMFGRRCLERHYRFVDRLPQTCAQRVRTYDGPRRGYDARCLRRNGYSLARG